MAHTPMYDFSKKTTCPVCHEQVYVRNGCTSRHNRWAGRWVPCNGGGEKVESEPVKR